MVLSPMPATKLKTIIGNGETPRRGPNNTINNGQ
jgi:hypothetical protein